MKHRPPTEMSELELQRFVDFFAQYVSETETALGLQNGLREIRVALPLLKGHFEGRYETPSSLIDRSGLPRGTGHRTIETMVDQGLILKRQRTKTGKTFTLHPSAQMLQQWLDYARRIKSLVGSVFGLSSGQDYFFGASYLSNAVISPLEVMGETLKLRGDLRVLLHADPAFMAMQRVRKQFEVHFGTDINVRALSIDRLRQEILSNTELQHSKYDIVTCDLCWMPEMIERGVLRPIGRLDDADFPDLQDFHPEALSTAVAGNELFGLPVQTTPELLIYRKDIFETQNLTPPETLDDMLSVAQQLHNTEPDMAGICWNGAHGTPVGTTFMMLMADFGQPVLDLPPRGGGFANRPRLPEQNRPLLNSPEAIEAAEYLLELRRYSPDTVLQMSWYERALCYAEGRAAMAYCYTQISQLYESDDQSPAYRQTGYTLHPNKHADQRIAPLGGWMLCAPVNLPDARLDEVRRAISGLSSPQATKLYIQNGSMVSSRFSVCNDPSVAHEHPTIPIVDRMARSGKLQMWPRPAVPELNRIVTILGDEIHTMLLRNKRPKEALRDAQAKIDKLMREEGHY
ncbi:ABC transporter substrate-binding protein [Pelagovum sp. HNIBRBA483]|uniref:ABC transporter substrate-binding protein n=1 Tax=Pelagovum sp. HNIBRBA483 TaxID=3233341 RepID=UPI0034A33761